MHRIPKLLTLLALATVAGQLLLACSAATPSPAITPLPQLLSPLVASTDLSPGPNRFVFAILDNESKPVRVPDVTVRLFNLEVSQTEPVEKASARFRQWPTGPGGVYVAHVTFNRAGGWGIEVSVPDAGRGTRLGRAAFQVNERSLTPPLGSPAPRSLSRTSRDAVALEHITSAPRPDPDLYSVTIAEAVATGKPTVVVFATPAFCASATCGPQVDVVKGLKDKYKGRASFIHVEIYDNPLEMRGDPSKGRLAPAVAEWHLPSEPWTFLIDGEGKVFAKFEGFTNAEELEEALLQLL